MFTEAEPSPSVTTAGLSSATSRESHKENGFCSVCSGPEPTLFPSGSCNQVRGIHLVLSLRSPGGPLDPTNRWPSSWHSQLVSSWHPTLTHQHQLLACLLHMFRISPFPPSQCPPRAKPHGTTTTGLSPWDHHHGNTTMEPPYRTTTMRLPPWDCHPGTATRPLHPAPCLHLSHQSVFCTAAMQALETSAENPPWAHHRRPCLSPHHGHQRGQSHVHFKGCPELQQHPPEQPQPGNTQMPAGEHPWWRDDCSPTPTAVTM